jgi:hypothetical protein
MLGEKLGLEKFLQDTAVHIIRHRLAHEVQDRGRHIDQLSAFDFDSLRKGLPWAIRIPSRRCVPPHSAGRGRFALEDFDRRFPCMFGKTWAGGKEAAVPPIESQIGGFIAIRAMKDFVRRKTRFTIGFARSWIS